MTLATETAGLSVQVVGVDFAYDASKPVFRSANFRFPSASRTVLLGKSGCGKSTLLALLSLIAFPSKGDIYWDDEPTCLWSDQLRSQRRNSNIGFVFQDHMLDPLLNASENVALPLQLSRQRISKSERSRKALAALQAVGLENYADSSPAQLSGGQSQRVAIARSIVTNPRLLLIDEPTASLDAATSTEILDLLDEINDVNKTTLIISTHDPVVLDHADNVYRLDQTQAAT